MNQAGGTRVVRLERLDLRVAQRPWRFADTRRAEIDAYFATLKRTTPDLWNGRVLLLHQWGVRGNVFEGACFEADFASMLAWRDWGFPDDAVRNFYGQGALLAVDGAFLLGVMSQHTANAGQIYFPSGTPDPSDVRDGAVDLHANVMRELGEETGLAAADVTPDAGWHAVFVGPRIGMMKILRSNESAEALRARIIAWLARQARPELADIRIVRGPADLDPKMPAFVAAFLHEMWGDIPLTPG
jgi:8-oxo-dGTP pyrophosphatase MutT (NUDIX family)